MQKWLYSICSFLSSATRLATSIFDYPHPKNFWSAFNFCDHVPTFKKSVYLIHPLIFQMQLILEFIHQTGHTHFWSCSFLTMPRQILFNKLLTFRNLYQHTKNKAALSLSSGEMLALNVLQSEWPRAFWPIFQEQNFSQAVGLYRNTVI